MEFSRYSLSLNEVRLEPLQPHHLPGLTAAIADGNLHELFLTIVPAPERLQAFLAKALADYQAGLGLTYAIIYQPDNTVIGSTRFMRAVPEHRRVEIGFTFLAQRFQRTGVNTTAKYLLLCQAFEQMDCLRVEFLTDCLNRRSRNAIERIGAKYEGLLRKHMQMRDGRIRDSVLYSITADEWPGVKQHLTFMMQNPPTDTAAR
ncbi:GNAT family protein [uncultured Gilvimarinus sp.]|uniref:GNAT family N-acetyltransferase n=1 Tax=uncultured Gilvimarinus sp. TaxID=1689143 RepID=UPI0030EF2B62